MNKQTTIIITIGFTVSILLSGIALGAKAKKHHIVKYPEGYRQWTHVKTMYIQEGHPLYKSFGGIHHIYANKLALRAMISGGQYPDGSVLVFDLLEAKDEKNAVVEGARKIVGVMQKDKKKFPETGGWGFDGFKDDTKERAVTDPKSDCFACHESQKQTDYVFSKYRK